MSKPVKILYLIDHLYSPDGGTEGQLLEMMRRLHGGGVLVELVCLYSYSDFVDSGSCPFPSRSLGLSRLASPAALRRLGGLVGYLRRNDFTALHTLFPECNMLGPLLARLAEVDHVTSRRDLGYWHTPARLAVLRATRALTGCWIANSGAVRDVVIDRERARPERVRVIHNGFDWSLLEGVEKVDLQRRFGTEDGVLFVSIVANLRPVKNVALLIEAVAILKRRGTRLKLLSIGRNEEFLDQHVALCRRLEVEDSVEFLGELERREALGLVSACDVGVNASNSEGLSNSVIECMALGVPVVTTDNAGNRELVRDGENGLLAPCGDAEAMAGALDRILSDRPAAARMGARAREWVVAEYDHDRVVAKHLAIYRKLQES